MEYFKSTKYCGKKKCFDGVFFFSTTLPVKVARIESHSHSFNMLFCRTLAFHERENLFTVGHFFTLMRPDYIENIQILIEISVYIFSDENFNQLYIDDVLAK